MSVYKLFIIVLCCVSVWGCASSKKVVYLQDVKVDGRIKAACEYRTVIHVDDLLSIIVSYVDFPVLGKLQVDGISRNELADLLKEKLSGYLKNPIVTIQFLNFKVTVLGEVRNPGSYKVNSERISILDALGMAGDLQINAKRKNVLVMREDGNEKVFSRVDLTSSELLHSPFFYLQQNEVVYVEPSRGRIVGGNAGTFLPYILSSVSTFVAVLALIIR